MFQRKEFEKVWHRTPSTSRDLGGTKCRCWTRDGTQWYKARNFANDNQWRSAAARYPCPWACWYQWWWSGALVSRFVLCRYLLAALVDMLTKFSIKFVEWLFFGKMIVSLRRFMKLSHCSNWSWKLTSKPIPIDSGSRKAWKLVCNAAILNFELALMSEVERVDNWLQFWLGHIGENDDEWETILNFYTNWTIGMLQYFKVACFLLVRQFGEIVFVKSSFDKVEWWAILLAALGQVTWNGMKWRITWRCSIGVWHSWCMCCQPQVLCPCGKCE